MTRVRAPTLLLVTPYLADANNGNWRTAARWARLLAPHCRVIVQAARDPVDAGPAIDADVMIALHARRSHEAIAAWRALTPHRPHAVVLTGTDLYRDWPAGDVDTGDSMTHADQLIVLQDDARARLPPPLRRRTQVIFQSARTLLPWPHKHADRLHCVMVAHLRDEKDPATVFAAWRALPSTVPATLTIIGAALDPALGRAAHALAAADSRVQWMGPRAHPWARQAIKRAHLLLVPSRMEGGANVVVEAVTAGTAVLGSRMSGNVGMLGGDYAGYFDVGDVTGLAALVARCTQDHMLVQRLERQCARRAPLFTPRAEAAALCAGVNTLMAMQRTRIPV
ncbi:MAG: selenoneine biosynthesis selenosugar synthase SenB [Betaproteobacteria bacterium]